MSAQVISLSARIDQIEREAWERQRVAEKWELLEEAYAIVEELPDYMLLRLMSACRMKLQRESAK
jgi:hypothetical protein